MNATVKLIIVGPEDGDQSALTDVISEVKIRTSAKNPATGELIPMDFGRLKAGDVDLQIFGCDRSHLKEVCEVVSPGIAGLVVLAGTGDSDDTTSLDKTIDEVDELGLPWLPAAEESLSDIASDWFVDPMTYAANNQSDVKNLFAALLERAVEAAA